MTDMLVKLYDRPDLKPIADRVRGGGVVIRPARAYERHQVVEWVEARFGPGWVSECAVAFSRDPITCFVAVQAGELLGFACIETTARGFFGPTGVDEAHRGKGIGSALLMTALDALEARGYAYAIIGGVGPKAFYEAQVGAIEIPGSTPGVYRDRIKRKKSTKTEP